MTTATAGLTIEDIQAGYHNEEWLGFGYLGSRANALDITDPDGLVDPAVVDAADAAVLAVANAKGWTRAQLFRNFLNDRSGRYYGDMVFGSDDPDFARAAAMLVRA